MPIRSFLTFSFLLVVPSLWAGSWIRLNQAGYAPDRTKQAVVLSDTDLQGQSWTLSAEGASTPSLQGILPAARTADDVYFAQAFSHLLDFSALQIPGTYTLQVAGAPSQKLKILDDPYSVFATQALMHLRAMRSGSAAARLHGASHLGDKAAIVYQVKGDWTNGAWQEATPLRTVDVHGGHYDAGDFIKFTLNEAYLAWHLLTAYQENPALFAKVQSPSTLPDILDEAKHSLDYLARTFPDDNTFVIQVGNGLDHQQGWRMPESDPLDGKRPALCALSRVHMGSAAAALALGAKVFATKDPTQAALYRSKAEAIYARARQNDSQRSAFERDQTNDFYFDNTDADNMALAAAELYGLTGTKDYLDQASAYAPPAGTEVSWGEWNADANLRLAWFDDALARSRALTEVARYENDNIWQAPGEYTWGTLHRWIGMANAHLRAQKMLYIPARASAPFLGVLDYVFGRNNWGVPMLASGDLPGSIRNVYNGIYRLTEAFPVGALSEGPGEKSMHLEMRQYFTVPANDPLAAFHTATGVFYDNRDDFMIQESTIGGQGDLLLMLALASSITVSPRSDSGTIPTSLYPAPDQEYAYSASQLRWSSYNDKSEGGVSEASAPLTSGTSVSSTLDTKANKVLDYAYSGLQGVFPAGLSKASLHGVRLVMDIPAGSVLRVNFLQSNIKDYGYHGKEILGKGKGSYTLDFSAVSQPFGTATELDASLLSGMEFVNATTGQKVTVLLDSVVFYRYANKPDYTTAVAPKRPLQRGPASLYIHKAGDLFHLVPAAASKAESLAVLDFKGHRVTTLYRNAEQRFVWNVRTVPAGVYWLHPADGSPAVSLVR